MGFQTASDRSSFGNTRLLQYKASETTATTAAIKGTCKDAAAPVATADPVGNGVPSVLVFDGPVAVADSFSNPAVNTSA